MMLNTAPSRMSLARLSIIQLPEDCIWIPLEASDGVNEERTEPSLALEEAGCSPPIKTVAWADPDWPTTVYGMYLRVCEFTQAMYVLICC